MKMKNKKNNISNDDNLLPLVNIIFLLLIFFMLAGVIAKQKEMYGVDLASVVIDEYTDKEENILFIKSDGKIIFNDIEVNIDSLEEKMNVVKEKEIIIAADKNVTSGMLNKVLLKLNKNNINNVTLLTNEK